MASEDKGTSLWRNEFQRKYNERCLENNKKYWQSVPCSAELLREQSRRLTDLVAKAEAQRRGR